RRHLEAGVHQLVELTSHRISHLRMNVSRVENGDARGEIDVAASLDIPDLGVGGAVGVNRQRVGYTPGDGVLPAGVQVCVRGQIHAPFSQAPACSSWPVQMPAAD